MFADDGKIKVPRFDGEVVGGLFDYQPPVYRRGETPPAEKPHSWATLLGKQSEEPLPAKEKVLAGDSRTKQEDAALKKGNPTQEKQTPQKGAKRQPTGITGDVLSLLRERGEMPGGELLAALQGNFTRKQLSDCLHHAVNSGKIRKLRQDAPIMENSFVLTDRELARLQAADASGSGPVEQRKPTKEAQKKVQIDPALEAPEKAAVPQEAREAEGQSASVTVDVDAALATLAESVADGRSIPAKRAVPKAVAAEVTFPPDLLQDVENRLETKLEDRFQDSLQHFRQVLEVLQELHVQRMALEKKVDHVVNLLQEKERKNSFFQELRKLVDKYFAGEA